MSEALHLQERELADAMLEGIERRPDQSFGEYYRGRESSCALGAAYEGIYRIPRNADGIRPKRLDLLFDCLDNEVRRCPACTQKRLPDRRHHHPPERSPPVVARADRAVAARRRRRARRGHAR